MKIGFFSGYYPDGLNVMAESRGTGNRRDAWTKRNFA